MIERVEADHAITPERLAADTAYGSGPNLSWLVEEKDYSRAHVERLYGLFGVHHSLEG